MPKHNMPPNWEPPAPAWQSYWQEKADPLVAGYFGVQAEQPSLLDKWATTAFSEEHAPFRVERGLHTGHGETSDYLYIAYWRRSKYLQWWERAQAWWNDGRRLREGVGCWREIITMPFDRFETLHSTESPHGISVSADGMDGPIKEHGYPGGMRDRIPLSDFHDLRAAGSFDTRLEARTAGGGKRVVVRPPENMCVIRSGQNWSYCTGEEKAYYLEKLHPVLLEGMRYLRENPAESNCYSLRFVDKRDDSWGATEQSFGLGYSLDVHAFEEWAKSHPTHLAIFRHFFKMVDTFGPEDMRLRLWHEVTALPNQGCEFEYLCCHPKTGLLRYI